MEIRKMDKYTEALGVWEHTIGKITHVIEPDMMDNKRIWKIVNNYQTNRDQSQLIEKICDYYESLVHKAYPELSDTEKQGLNKWIIANGMQIMEDVMISHRMSTKEDMDKAKSQQGDVVKNLMTQA
jgi:hypothetical protein